VLARLLQIGTIAGAIERNLALLAATLRADAPVGRGTETFFLSYFADRATQIVILLSIIIASAGEQLRLASRKIATEERESCIDHSAVSGLFRPFWAMRLQINV
jgi:hypothetical protein